MLTYKDFDTRSEFINYLGLYHNNRNDPAPDFLKIFNVDPSDYNTELIEIYENIQEIQQQWNNQSIENIEQTVKKKGQRHLDIMQAQKREKLQAGYHPNSAMYRVKTCNTNSYFTYLANELGLANGFARFHIQFPGEVTAWHTDIFSPAHEFLSDTIDDIPDSDVGLDKNIRRILIALDNWDWGQILVFGKTPWINWNAGDVIFWEYGVPHGAANMGYKPRISVSITGLSTDKFKKICNYARTI